MLKGQILKVEAALFPMSTMNISQGMDSNFSHKGNYCIDITGATGLSEQAYAPTALKVVMVSRTIWGNAIVWESLDKVLWADGSYDYYCMRMNHDDNTSGITIGTKYNQGDKIYDEGKSGKATGIHIHLNVGRGKYIGMTTNIFGNSELKNEVEPYKLFYVNNTFLKNDKGYPWKTL